MRDNEIPPNLGQPPRQYDQNFVGRAFRSIEQFLNTIRVKGPIVVSDLTVDNIIFPSTQIPSSNPNSFDDYSEETWVPALTFGGGSTGIVYSTQTGDITKKGREVTASFDIILTNKGTSVGSAALAGLPYTPANRPHAGIVGLHANMAGLTGVMTIHGTTTLSFKAGTSATDTAGATDANFTNTSRVSGSITYFV